MNDVKSNESLIFDLRVKIIAQTFLSRAEGRADTLCCEGDGEDGRLSEEAERHDSGDNHGHSLREIMCLLETKGSSCKKSRPMPTYRYRAR